MKILKKFPGCQSLYSALIFTTLLRNGDSSISCKFTICFSSQRRFIRKISSLVYFLAINLSKTHGHFRVIIRVWFVSCLRSNNTSRETDSKIPRSKTFYTGISFLSKAGNILFVRFFFFVS